ncbi:hypothetical protein KQX54_021866 [Cotesia glomerata]|uniref:Uncharacterized protein n=1 Tax=Cotesia glomerata TaxID=32391 RepID=A0AAV7JAF5_COTGL|nr:hypothetical protein KQX54_021866 [Cotesia glomerata]
MITMIPLDLSYSSNRTTNQQQFQEPLHYFLVGTTGGKIVDSQDLRGSRGRGYARHSSLMTGHIWIRCFHVKLRVRLYLRGRHHNLRLRVVAHPNTREHLIFILHIASGTQCYYKLILSNLPTISESKRHETTARTQREWNGKLLDSSKAWSDERKAGDCEERCLMELLVDGDTKQGSEREARVICDSKRTIHLASCQDSIVDICLRNQSQRTHSLSFSCLVHPNIPIIH